MNVTLSVFTDVFIREPTYVVNLYAVAKDLPHALVDFVLPVARVGVVNHYQRLASGHEIERLELACGVSFFDPRRVKHVVAFSSELALSHEEMVLGADDSELGLFWNPVCLA